MGFMMASGSDLAVLAGWQGVATWHCMNEGVSNLHLRVCQRYDLDSNDYFDDPRVHVWEVLLCTS